jgi:GT2 family glycosyltransferase
MSKLTVVIPTYNRAALLKVSLASILAQDYPDFQVVILDNASTADTEAVVRTFVFGWPAFWWGDYYVGLRQFLQKNFHYVVSNSRIVALALRTSLHLDVKADFYSVEV